MESPGSKLREYFLAIQALWRSHTRPDNQPLTALVVNAQGEKPSVFQTPVGDGGMPSFYYSSEPPPAKPGILLRQEPL